MPWCRLHYHLVWATRDREPLINGEAERIIHSRLHIKAHELRLVIHAIGGVDDHLHVVLSIPPALAVAHCTKHLKGASARAVNQEVPADSRFGWQGEYGAVTLGERSLPSAIDYVRNQREHHTRGTLIGWYETINKKDST
jgi:putative transposase